VITSSLGFALLLVVVASISLRASGFGEEELRTIACGISWVVYCFAGVVALNLNFVEESQDGALSAVMASGVEPVYPFVSKAFVNLVLLVGIHLLSNLALGVLLYEPMLYGLGSMLIISVLASVSFCSLGTLLSAIAGATKGREIVLPLILFPLSVPILLASVSLSREVFEGGALATDGFWFSLEVGLGIISLALSSVLFEFVTRE